VIFFRNDQIVRRDEDTARRGRMDLIELFSEGRLTLRLRDNKGTGWDTLYYYQDNQLVREEQDTNGDGVFDLRILYAKDHVVAQEGDTNGDRRVDVWVRFHEGERVEQLEDQKYEGRVTARYVFKGGEMVSREQVDNIPAPRSSEPFVEVETTLKNAAITGSSNPPDRRATRIGAGLESASEIK
jgi:hypothetical protein